LNTGLDTACKKNKNYFCIDCNNILSYINATCFVATTRRCFYGVIDEIYRKLSKEKRMLNKKQFLGLMLLLSPMLALTMDRGGAGRGGARTRAAGDATATSASATGGTDFSGVDSTVDADVDGLVDDVAGAAAGAAGAGAGVGAGTVPSGAFASINNFINGYLNAPLNMALTKITAFGAKSKLAVSALLIYIGYSASGAVVQDAQAAVSTVKSAFGADCEDGGCRGGKDDKWTEAA
jgi:hypothetical protein